MTTTTTSRANLCAKNEANAQQAKCSNKVEQHTSEGSVREGQQKNHTNSNKKARGMHTLK